MLYPNGPEARKRMLVWETMNMLSGTGEHGTTLDELVNMHIKSSANEEPRDAVYERVESELRLIYEMNGGEKTLFKCPKNDELFKEFEKASTNGILAGNMLYRIMQMDKEKNIEGGPSVKKAIFLIDQYDRSKLANLGTHVNKAYLKKYWVMYKPVAHIWAGYIFWKLNDNSTKYDFRKSDDGLFKFLALSEVFREFGESFLPHGQKEPLLNPDETWKQRPDHIEYKVNFTLPKMTSEELKALSKYKVS